MSLSASDLRWGAQDVSSHEQGAYTGEVSATMLREWYKLGIDMGYVYEGSPVVVPEEEDFNAAQQRQTRQLGQPREGRRASRGHGRQSRPPPSHIVRHGADRSEREAAR